MSIIGKRLADEHDLGDVNVKRSSPKDVGEQVEMSALIETQNVSHCSEGHKSFKRTDASLAWATVMPVIMKYFEVRDVDYITL